jgi:hypothetical protein
MDEREIFDLLAKSERKPVPNNTRKEVWAAVIVCVVILGIFTAVLMGWL